MLKEVDHPDTHYNTYKYTQKCVSESYDGEIGFVKINESIIPILEALPYFREVCGQKKHIFC